MDFIIDQLTLSSGAFFLREKEAYSGVHKIADKVMHDLELVFGSTPKAAEEISECASSLVIYGTTDRSPVLASLSEQGLIALEELRGKNEVYLFQVIDAPSNGISLAYLNPV